LLKFRILSSQKLNLSKTQKTTKTHYKSIKQHHLAPSIAYLAPMERNLADIRLEISKKANWKIRDRNRKKKHLKI